MLKNKPHGHMHTFFIASKSGAIRVRINYFNFTLYTERNKQ